MIKVINGTPKKKLIIYRPFGKSDIHSFCEEWKLCIFNDEWG